MWNKIKEWWSQPSKPKVYYPSTKEIHQMIDTYAQKIEERYRYGYLGNIMFGVYYGSYSYSYVICVGKIEVYKWVYGMTKHTEHCDWEFVLPLWQKYEAMKDKMAEDLRTAK